MEGSRLAGLADGPTDVRCGQTDTAGKTEPRDSGLHALRLCVCDFSLVDPGSPVQWENPLF